MTLRDRLESAMTAAMRSGDALRRDAAHGQERGLQRQIEIGAT